MKILLILIGMILILNGTVFLFYTNFNIGFVITLSIGIFLLGYGIFFAKINQLTSKGFLRYMRYFAYICFLYMLSVIIFISVFANSDTVTYKENALIVLGCGINGEQITYPLWYRLNKALEYYNNNPECVIVVSGGQGRDEDITEALAMERYLIKNGVPPDKIIKEEKSTSTYENFKFSKEILEQRFNNSYKVAFITNNFHIFRSYKIAKKVGFTPTHLHAGLNWYSLPVNYIREFFALHHFLINGW